MQIDFTKLQESFINKIKNEEKLILKGNEVSFEVQPNFELENYNLKIYIKIFGEEFSVGYPKEKTTTEELMDDFYSRLHDYDTDNPKSHIIDLKIQELEKKNAEQICQLKEKILNLDKKIKSEDISIDISDLTSDQDNERGFPKFGIFVMVKDKQILVQEIDFNEYNYKLTKELEKEMEEKIKT